VPYTVRVGLDWFVPDALSGEALDERVPSDSEGDPARTRARRVRLDEQPRVIVDLPENLLPDATVWGLIAPTVGSLRYDVRL
jgi:hypothetical protein